MLPRLTTLKLAADIAGELLLPAPLHLRLDRHRLERLDAGDALHQERLILGAALEFHVEAAPEQRRRSRRDADVEGKGRKHDPGQQRRVEEHHRQEYEGEKQIDDQGERRAGQKVADVLELAHPRDRIADAPRLEIGDRQRQQMAEQPGAQLDVDAVGRVREQIGAQNAQDRLEYADRDKTDDEHVEGAHAAVHEHLVDHDLEEQRRNKGKQLQEERGNKHLAKETAVFVNGAEEPGDVKPTRQINQSRAARHQHETTIPHRLKLGPRHQWWAAATAATAPSALSSPTLARSKNPPSRSVAIPGKGVLTSRSQLVTRDRALRPSSLAQRSISGMPIGPAPKRWRICSGSAPRPWKRSSITRTKRPGSAGLAPSDSVLNSRLQGAPRHACGCVNNCG